MRRISSRIAVVIVLTLLFQNSPAFAQVPLNGGPQKAAHLSDRSLQSPTNATVVVPLPSQFVEPPTFMRHSLKGTLIGAGIYAGAAWILRLLICIP